jgi:hypothetical protein
LIIIEKTGSFLTPLYASVGVLLVHGSVANVV